MGLFDVYMPMVYREREKAFLRLQQHIIQKSKDESIFAWCGVSQEFKNILWTVRAISLGVRPL